MDRNWCDRNTGLLKIDLWPRCLSVTERVDNIMTHLKNDKLLMCSQVTYFDVNQRARLILILEIEIIHGSLVLLWSILELKCEKKNVCPHC